MHPWPPRPCEPPLAGPCRPLPISSGTSLKEALASPRLRSSGTPTSSASTSDTSTTRTLWSAAPRATGSSLRFHPKQPCLTAELGLRCAAHPTDHDLFVALCHQCDISIHLPPPEYLPDHSPHVMAFSSPGLEVQDTHAWMIAAHRDAEDAHRAGWPRVSSRATPPTGTPPPPVGRRHAVSAAIPMFSWLPENYGILHDASWCPKTRRCGGAVAVFCPDTLRFQIYPVAIPLRLDNAYTAELYTAWVALSTRGPSADPAFTFRSSSWHFADCKGYITAQEGRWEPDDSLQGDPIRECDALAGGHPPPRHLYSHITRTWLDALLDQVDAAARRSAESCPATVGWLSPIQEPRICFSHAGLQVHDALPHARRALLVPHHASAKSPPPQRNPALGECTIAVSHGLLSWGNHLAVTGLCLSLSPPPGTRLALSASYPTLATTSCLSHLTLYSVPTTIGGSRPGSPRGVMPGAIVRPLPGESSSSGAMNPSCWPWMAPRPTRPSLPIPLDALGPSPRRTEMPFSTEGYVLRTCVASYATSYSPRPPTQTACRARATSG